MNWLVRKLDVGDHNEPAVKGQTAVAINVNNAEESNESCIKIYIFEIQFTWYKFLESWGVFYLQKLLERKRTKIQTNIELKR